MVRPVLKHQVEKLKTRILIGWDPNSTILGFENRDQAESRGIPNVQELLTKLQLEPGPGTCVTTT